MAIDDRAEYFEAKCRHLFVVSLKDGANDANDANDASAQDQWSALVNGDQTSAFTVAQTPIQFTRMAEKIARFRGTVVQDGSIEKAIRLGYSRVLTRWLANSHGAEYRSRATETRQVLLTRAGFST